MNKVYAPGDPECYIVSSEPFKIHQFLPNYWNPRVAFYRS
jgi:hypothetical protein